MNKIIDLLEKQLPSSAFDIHGETILIQEHLDDFRLIIRLNQLANCYVQLGDIRDTEQEDHNGYKVALYIYRKLAQYVGGVENDKRVLLCKKLSSYYEDLEENEEALEYLQETIELEEPTIGTLYRLGRLNMACDELDEAKTNYQKILSDKSTNERKGLEKIVREKLNGIEAKVKSQERPWSRSSSESSKSTSSIEVASPLDQLSRNPTIISMTSQQRNEAEPGLRT